MNYCPRCKLRLPPDAAVCEKCGGSARVVGAASDSAAGETGPPAGDLALQLAGLRHEVQESRRRMRRAAAIATVLLIAFISLLVGLHLYEVSQYAEIAGLSVNPTEGRAGEATIVFERRRHGKVEFIREAAGRTETLVEHGAPGDGAREAREEFAWSGGENEDYTIVARYRAGWSLKEERFKATSGKINRVE